MYKFKSIPANKTSYDHSWELKKWYKITGELKICNNGFHCSDNFIDAMLYVTPGYLAIVDVRGDVLKEFDKSVHSEMKVLRWVKWTKKDSIALSIFASELSLENYEIEHPDDGRPRKAIEAAKKVMKRDTVNNRSAAWAAAWAAALSAKSAAWAAAWAAWAAESAAKSAAKSDASAAWAAAWAAALSAKSAAASAESVALSAVKQSLINKCHEFIMDRKFK